MRLNRSRKTKYPRSSWNLEQNRKGDSKMSKYLVTLEVYVWADSLDEAIVKAEEASAKLEYDDGSPEVENVEKVNPLNK